MQSRSLPSMSITLPPADVLLSAGTWCAVLAEAVARTSAIEWQMRVRNAVEASSTPTPRFVSGIPKLCPCAWSDFWLQCADVARWLGTFGYLVAHDEEALEQLHAVIEGAAAAPPAAGKDSRAWPLTSPEVAQAFADLRDWDQKRWSKELGAPPEWLLVARKTPGERGRSVATWDPVELAHALIDRCGVQTKSVRARFQTVPLLQPWLAAWVEHEALYFPGK